MSSARRVHFLHFTLPFQLLTLVYVTSHLPKSHRQLLEGCPQWLLKTVSAADAVECRSWRGWLVFHGDSADLGSEFWRALKTVMGYVCNGWTRRGGFVLSGGLLGKDWLRGAVEIGWHGFGHHKSWPDWSWWAFREFSIIVLFPSSIMCLAALD